MHQTVFASLNIVAILLFSYLVPEPHSKMLIILVFALTGWSMKLLPSAVVSLTIIVLIPIMGLGTFEDSLSGFSKPFVWLLVSAFVFAAAMEKTGIGKRIAFNLLYFAKGSTKRTVPFLFLVLIILGFFIPTAAGRTSTIIPVCVGMIQVIKDKQQAVNFAKTIMIGATFTSGFICWALLTGSNSSIYAVAAIQATIGYKWNYIYWFICSFPIMLVVVGCLWLVLKKLFPIDTEVVPKDDSFIKNELAALGKMTSAEWRIMILGILILASWTTEPYHGLSVPLTALIGSIITCLPGIGVQKWKEVSPVISWDAIILFGAGYAIADTIQRNGTATWIALKITEFIPTASPFGAALFILILVLFMRLGFAEMLAITATILPITISLAEIWGINPLWLAQVMLIACSFGLFFPFQSTSNLLTFSYGYYTEKNLFHTGILLAPMVIVVVLISALYYWPLVGLNSVLPK
ncbi:anion transporter [Planomicrobium stackebrandtii]|uniref:Sodium-dependent dicarboxylate transporter SdcS n=1 Tax=Planomicrobium stackebrandtii TaxID=253160 RepID=A0ABU0GTY0_9BACL|nr:DASS family sodium-coupled anion symporter [Planomicrobium stackebrandtii]MDQ0428819.1 anion transporter [Planomicrobium stackebrandtii]